MKLNQLAVGENEETRTFYAPEPGSGLASLYDRPDAPTTITEQVHVTTLDAYVDREKIARIDLLKLDVEGWEWRALKGARRLLGEEKIGAVYFEFSPLNVFTRTFFHDLWQVLQPAGFYFFYVDPQQGYRLRPIPEYSGEWEKFDGTSYYYAKHKNLAVEPVLVA